MMMVTMVTVAAMTVASIPPMSARTTTMTHILVLLLRITTSYTYNSNNSRIDCGFPQFYISLKMLVIKLSLGTYRETTLEVTSVMFVIPALYSRPPFGTGLLWRKYVMCLYIAEAAKAFG